MKLDVVKADVPWFAAGLHFECTECGNCCSGGRGYVWLRDVEVDRLAAFLGITPERFVQTYCRRVGHRLSLRELHKPDGNYDCIFLRTVVLPDGTQKRVCGAYEARPLQCRTFPFWDSILFDPDAWNQAAVRCPGINRGRKFSRRKIEALRDAEEWPAE